MVLISKTDVHYAPQGSAVPIGQQLLENYLQGVSSNTTIQGSTDSTPIESLQLALSEIQLAATIPALHQNLITSASLVFPTDIVQTGVAQSSFVLDNPFTASINILDITANATFQDLFLGDIDHVDVSSSPIHADGHANISSEQIPFNFNLDPTMIIKLLTAGAANNGVDLGPLPDLFNIALANPDYGSQINTVLCVYIIFRRPSDFFLAVGSDGWVRFYLRQVGPFLLIIFHDT